MEKPIIEVKNIGKRYKITHERGKYIALRDVIANTLKHPFAFLMDKAKSATGLKKKEEFWALRDVNFTVKRGEVVGIIGHNGAGKSTLLKILSQITPPTEGEIILRGRVGSLLEVGTGFHPELTGRENIFLNGAILGMGRNEIASKFDQIVEFAGIEKFLDTPVKYYSSGMYVRLAFSVAAHMESDILLVDEVLAVGDAEFQRKCLGKMEEITKKQGRTIIFVSHNMSAIQNICERCILLDGGKISGDGETSKIIDLYISQKISSGTVRLKPSNEEAAIEELWLENEQGEIVSSVEIGEDMYLCLNYGVYREVKNMDVAALISKNGFDLLYSFDTDAVPELRYNRKPGKYGARVKLPASLLKEGTYLIRAKIGTMRDISDPNACIKLEIINSKLNLKDKSYRIDRPGFMHCDLEWITKEK